jgi:lysophospholipase L1-like esterase
LDLAISIHDRSSTRVYSRQFKAESYGLSTPEEVRQIGVEFDRMGEMESYVYNPWTTFTERPFEGTLLNIEQKQSYPSRATAPCQPLRPGQKDLLIWMFGGSTTLGWGVSDSNTVPSHLQRELQAAQDDYRVRVVNHGHSYYFSSLEVSLYVALLRKDERPRMVVFLDGLNDVSGIGSGQEDPVFAPQADKGWEAERRRRYAPGNDWWFSVNAGFPIHRIARRLAMTAPTTGDQPKDAGAGGQDATNRILEVMRTNRHMADAISERLGIDAFFFLQPIPVAVEKQGTYEFAYPALRQEIQRSTAANFCDISTPLVIDHPYVDRTHYSDTGSLVVAQRMVRVIKSSLESRGLSGSD